MGRRIVEPGTRDSPKGDHADPIAPAPDRHGQIRVAKRQRRERVGPPRVPNGQHPLESVPAHLDRRGGGFGPREREVGRPFGGRDRIRSTQARGDIAQEGQGGRRAIDPRPQRCDHVAERFVLRLGFGGSIGGLGDPLAKLLLASQMP